MAATKNCTKRTRLERLQNATFQTKWKLDYPWVFLGEDSKMYCSYCIDTKKSNVFTSGCGDFLKDYVVKHNAGVDHRQALQERMLRRSMESSVVTAHKKDKAAVLSAMRTAYYLAKKNRPNADFDELLSFQGLQVSRPNLIADISIIMVAPCNRAAHYIFIPFLSSSFFFSSPNLSGRRLDVYRTSTKDDSKMNEHQRSNKVL